MVTNQLMVRKMGDFDVIQRTEDGYFESNSLLSQWNNVKDNPRRDMSKYLSSPKTIEFINTIKSKSQNSEVGDYQVVIRKHGKSMKEGGRSKDEIYMHPYLFLDFAMWINPSFKYDVLKFVSDQMIEYRNMAGDSYQKLAKAVLSICGNRNSYNTMKKVAEALNYIVFNENKKMIRNENGDEKKQRELYDLEDRIAMLIGDGFIHNYNELIAYMRKLWQRKYQPKVLK